MRLNSGVFLAVSGKYIEAHAINIKSPVKSRAFSFWVACAYNYHPFAIGRRRMVRPSFDRIAGESRIRGRKLQAIRKRVLEANPLCQICGLRASTEVDHIVALVNGGMESPHDDSNRQALCGPCHERKTERDLGRKHRPRIGFDGYPLPD